MLKKDELKIEDELKKLVEQFLLNEFKDSHEKPVESVEYLNIVDLEYDSDNQERKKIVIKKMIAATRVHIQFSEGSTSSLNTQFINNKPIEFIIDFSTDEVELIESNVKFIEHKLF